MSRVACNLYKESSTGKNELIDDNCVIGYDESMETFFFQSGIENSDGDPLIWLGVNFQEYTSIAQIEDELKHHKLILEIDPNDVKALMENGLDCVTS